MKMESYKFVIMVDIDETTYIDGNYENKKLATEVGERWAKKYPHLDFKLAALLADNHPIPDELFIPNNRPILELANHKRGLH